VQTFELTTTDTSARTR